MNRSYKLLPFILLLGLFALPASSWAKVTQILIVHAYSQEYPWTKGQHQGFLKRLKLSTPHALAIHTEYLDTKRVPYNKDYATQFANYVRLKYQNYRPDAIYVTDDNALTFAHDHLLQLFPTSPIFFSGVNNLAIDAKLDKTRITGVFEKKESAPNIKAIQALFGEITQIDIVGDKSNTYQAIEKELRNELRQHPDLEVRYIAHQELAPILRTLDERPEAPVLLTTLGALRNQQQEPLPLEHSISRIVDLGKRPIISMEDAYLLQGVIGGYVTSGPAQGRATARLVTTFLNGTPVAQIDTIKHGTNEYIFNDETLEAFDLELNGELASQSQLLNPRGDLFTRYQHLLTALLLTVAAAFAATLILYSADVATRNRQLRKQSLQVQAKEQLLQQSEEKYRALFEHSEDAMLLIHQNRIIDANSAALKALGYKRLDALKNRPLWSFSAQHQPNNQAAKEKLVQHIDAALNQGHQRFSWLNQHSNGSKFLVELTLTRIPYLDGDALFCMWHERAN